jgi:hypothetical protein
MFVEPLCPLFGRRNVRLAITAGYVRSTGRMAELKVQQHPDKTFIGRISRGFDFLGYRFSAAGLVGIAVQTVKRCVERMNRLYEQGADAVCIGNYVRRCDPTKKPSGNGWLVCFGFLRIVSLCRPSSLSPSVCK